jgi:hypothetical protein
VRPFVIGVASSDLSLPLLPTNSTNLQVKIFSRPQSIGDASAVPSPSGLRLIKGEIAPPCLLAPARGGARTRLLISMPATPTTNGWEPSDSGRWLAEAYMVTSRPVRSRDGSRTHCDIRPWPAWPKAHRGILLDSWGCARRG